MFGNFDIKDMLLLVVPILLALTVHEFAHGMAAYRLGDNTAKNQGRLTLNPISHLDPLGTLMIFLSGLFGWAKPVPFNPANFKNPVQGTALVALAGPMANFITAIAVALIFKLTMDLGLWGDDAHRLLLGSSWKSNLYIMVLNAVLINIGLGLFNLLPFPPLDGFKVISYFLPLNWVISAEKHSIIFMIVFLILIVTGQVQAIIIPIIMTLFAALLN